MIYRNKCYSCKETKELTKVQKIFRRGWKWFCQDCNFIEIKQNK